ncbi:hypothetical protein HGG78_18240 [Vibrio aestuarianus]|uniref:hypothetical protein n=1 Tax=Vibrio aestuarianus TaxID=28171 RepID=UPI0015592012|nr:hypothetical protein [Vibrio aestuarianus]NGZ15655.1 hypothetical protein [Vibrio aestuarianus]NKZ51803.1 hypothetical protein [Vibrio aestuarianus]
MKGDFCNIKNFTPTSRTLEGINDMNNVIQMSNYLENIINLLPFYQIFAGRNSYAGVAITSAGWNAYTYDWKSFSEAIMAIPQIKRERLEYISYNQMLYAKGKDYDFWKCVYNSF